MQGEFLENFPGDKLKNQINVVRYHWVWVEPLSLYQTLALQTADVSQLRLNTVPFVRLLPRSAAAQLTHKVKSGYALVEKRQLITRKENCSDTYM